jgi:hypothetical protein
MVLREPKTVINFAGGKSCSVELNLQEAMSPIAAALRLL